MNEPTQAPSNLSELLYPIDKTLVDLFVEQARQTPDRVAVVCAESQLTYAELDRQSSQLAHYLRKQGVQQETLVPICVERSVAMIVGLLGILKAGGAYVPIDPDYPADRIEYILADLSATVVVTDAATRARPDAESARSDGPNQSRTVVCLDRDAPVVGHESADAVSERPAPQQLAYVIYTSGSTGRPKGVMVEHASVVSLMKMKASLFDFGEQDVWTMFHSFCFDFSVWEMYGALLFGGKLIVVPKHVAKDAQLYSELLATHSVTVLNQTPSAFYVLQEHIVAQSVPVSVRYVIFGGEALLPGKLRPWHRAFPTCQLINMYGITETTVHVTYLALQEEHLAQSGSLIGRAIPTLTTHVLDEQQQPVAIGETGELYVGGAGLARGYLNQPELTAQRFIPNPFADQTYPVTQRLYRSGDLVRLLPDGDLEYMGRIDAQVKIRGYRIELGEIEQTLQQHPDVKQAVVVAKTFADADVRLVGYVVMDGPFEKATLITFLNSRLPDYMVPAVWVAINQIPLTSNGKVDRRALPDPDSSPSPGAFLAPGNPTEEKLLAVWRDVLVMSRLGVTDNFFESGGNSLLAARTVAALKQTHAVEIPITKLYQFPTVQLLAGYVDGRTRPAPRASQPNTTRPDTDDVAIIGMAGRFPGADTVEALWDVVRAGQETIRFFAPDELDPSLPHDLIQDPQYVNARGILAGASQFDAGFFGLNPKLAEVMDPQQRIFLEIAWEALEQAGYLPQQYGGSIGVWAGCGNNTYYLNNVLTNPGVVRQVGSFQAMTVNEKDFIASRTAYQLNLGGPAVSVYSACSTSLLAIAQAVDSIRLGHCTLALAGGASVTAPINSGHLYEEGAMLSRDGHCRPFDANATGTVFSDGAGVVLLKARSAAERDGDTIYAIIKGTGVNNDGSGKGSFTAPNADGQAGAIRMALADAQVDPATISYVEAHGTATPLGDPIEIDGLTMAFGDLTQKQFCALGSIKSNFGHLTAAAGVAGLIKTTLALYHRQLPTTAGFSTPNPAIAFADSPFYVNDTHRDWPATVPGPNGDTSPRRAGVSSFGVGGTNVHVVLEEHIAAQPVGAERVSAVGRPVHLAVWSAKSGQSLTAYAAHLVSHLDQRPDLTLADVAYTLQHRQTAFAHRRFVLAGSNAELAKALRTPATPQTVHSPAAGSSVPQPGTLVGLFPGQGAQYVNMGRELYENEPVYRQAVDTCADELTARLGLDIRQVLFPDAADEDAARRLKNTRYTQPALFVTEYALARLWQSWGIEPTVYCGHSIGEFVAAHLAGVFTLPDALALVAARGQLISNLPEGSMLSVRLNADAVLAMLPSALSLAAINSRHLCVVAGPDDAIAAFASVLKEQHVPHRLLETSHAFHSAMLDPIIGEFEQIVRGIVLQRPQKPIVSTVSGTWLTDADATNPHYWATHMRATVRFADALETLFTVENVLLLEAGPGSVTSTLARQQAIPRPVNVVTSLDTAKGTRTEYESMLHALGQLWINGMTVNWAAFQAGQTHQRVPLPTYAFDRTRCWVDPPRQQPNPTEPVAEQDADYALPSLPEETPITIPVMRRNELINKVRQLLNDTSGILVDEQALSMSFLELGLDSLALTQFSYTLRKTFDLPISFRQLSSAYTSIDALVDFMDRELPADAFQPPAPVNPPTLPTPRPVSVAPPRSSAAQPRPLPTSFAGSTNADAVADLFAQQLQIMADQLAFLRGQEPAARQPAAESVSPALLPVKPVASPAPSVAPTPEKVVPSATAPPSARQAFGAGARIERKTTSLSEVQQAFLTKLTQRYTDRTAASKAYAQENRRSMADPRAVTGFRPLTKELVYPLVVERSKGSRLWDIDGNEYIDALNGFGSTMFGYQPEFLKTVLHDQVELGYEVGPQHKLAGSVARMVCEFTGFDRAALCNTGSEAVLGALRMARTVTGRSLVVTFTGSYHGIFDEVISRGSSNYQSYPAALGIPAEAVQNVLILEYGTDESLRIIRERAAELAAVLVEPVQSRRPEFQPVEFLKQVRAVTEESGTALIFDEVITGFRMHPGGAQALFGVRADLATYGKVIGGGLPIGVVAGKALFMDALDGGHWQYGDDSYPEADITFFAGTFVRHPLALAAANASLHYLREQGPALQERLTTKAKQLADAVNATLLSQQLPMTIAQFGSLWKLKFLEEVPYGELLFTLMREKRIHIWDGFPCFMTEAHTDDDIQQIIAAFLDSLQELTEAEFLPAKGQPTAPLTTRYTHADNPPTPGARLGRDRQGSPGWFVTDPDQPGKYRQLEPS